MKCKTCNAYIEPNPRGRKKLYCSKECRPYYVAPKGAGLSNCQICNKPLDSVGTPGRPKRNCSKKCRLENRARNLRKKPNIKNCKVCQNTFVTTKEQSKFCSTDCRIISNREVNAKKHKNKMAELYPNGLRTVDCGWCGNPRTFDITKSTPTAYHATCTKEAQSARYRIKTVKRQKLTSPYRISHEQVVKQYGSDCHICHEPIDLALPRTHRFGLTVDHLMPVSKGGTDDITNLRPAHWICNIKKSDKMPENKDA